MSKPDPARVTMQTLTQIGIIAQLTDTMLNAKLEDGLSLAGFRVLHHFVIRDVDGQGPASLANAFQVTKGAMTNTIGRLEAAGYVKVSPDPKDGRGKIVRITAAGRKARDRALMAMAPEIFWLLGEVRAEEFEAALPFLTKLKNALDARRDPAPD